MMFGKDVVKRVIQLAQSMFFYQQGNAKRNILLGKCKSKDTTAPKIIILVGQMSGAFLLAKDHNYV